MKRFVLLIVAVLMVGCSSNNSPVAPNVIYNVTGGEAVFKVELKDYPLVVDSVYIQPIISGGEATILAHCEIPFTFTRDNFLCVGFPNMGNTFWFYKDSRGDISDSVVQDLLPKCSGVLCASVADSSWIYVLKQKFEFSYSLESDKIKVNIFAIFSNTDSIGVYTPNDTTALLNQFKTVCNDSWFTFKIYMAINK